MEVEKEKDSNSNSFSLPLVEKYRPKSLSDIVSHEDIIKTLNKFLEQKTIPHLLFHGPAGTGKTSSVMAIARTLYEEKDLRHMILELNASDDRGIKIVRDDIKNFSGTNSLLSNKYKFKLVILDEVDMMTSIAQAALRRVIEKFSTNVRFCLICNQISKLIPAVQSRCLKFRFIPLKPSHCVKTLHNICNQEGFSVQAEKGKEEKDTLLTLINLCSGDMRRILNLLESVALSNNNIITEEKIYSISAKPSNEVLKKIKNICQSKQLVSSFKEIITLKNEMMFSTTDLIDLLLSDFVNNIKETGQFNRLTTKDKVNFFKTLQKIDLISQKGGNDKLCLSQIASLLTVTLKS